ncbi:MAG: adenylosuccinate lyase [Acidobacteria bacterium]|nr:MAG: adenylosuccinate lyase [Acidobacteriota bacterium]
MIERYTLPEIAEIWSDQSRFEAWLEVETLAVEGWAELGVIPEQSARAIRERATVSAKRVNEIEKVTDHDVAAFVQAAAESVGEEGRWIHYGLTSSDVVDTALATLMVRAMRLIEEEADALFLATRDLAFEYRDTPCVGRTHGVHAEPTTFGAKIAGWAFEIDRGRRRLARARETVSVGKLSGAVGTYNAVRPEVEQFVCENLGLVPEGASTQVVARDRHAEYMWAIAAMGASLERFAQEIRHLQRTEVREAEEAFGRGQKGSSAMPHKKNPITCERICGLARILRANLGAALEDVALWHERDISHSSVERVILPDSTALIHYMLVRFRRIVENMRIYPDRMLENLNANGGLVFSQRVLLALVESGLSRDDAYASVQRNALRCWEEGGDFRSLLEADSEVTEHLSEERLDQCFDIGASLMGITPIFERLGTIT